MPRDPDRFPLDDRLRMQHMLDAAGHIMSFVAGRSRQDLDRDVMLVRALMNAVQEIGEAAARIRDAYNACLLVGEKTHDLGGHLGTTAFADAVIARFKT